MSGIVVVYELEQPAAGPPPGAEGVPRRVHAAPAAPGQSEAVGPRTLCGKDTFAMTRARRTPSGEPGEPWYPDEYTSAVCPDCDAAMET
ncbi:hypothetical protein [Streptomyces capoamus]|uniref:hypothetical protein n=1 Tax=Streptomyces capoamus TaxID=68183 RepID=UPI00339248CC